MFEEPKPNKDNENPDILEEGDLSEDNPSFINQIQEIRREHKCDLFDALVIFASKLPDYHKYDGPMKEQIISAVEYEKREKEWNAKVGTRKRELRAENKSMKEIIEILKQEGLWRE